MLSASILGVAGLDVTSLLIVINRTTTGFIPISGDIGKRESSLSRSEETSSHNTIVYIIIIIIVVVVIIVITVIVVGRHPLSG